MILTIDNLDGLGPLDYSSTVDRSDTAALSIAEVRAQRGLPPIEPTPISEVAA